MLNGRNSLLTTLIFFLLVNGLQAQDASVSISLEEAILEASGNNKSILISRTDEKIAEANYRQTNAVFLPQASVSYTAMTTNNPLNVFGFKLQQQSVTGNDFNPAQMNNPSATQNYMTRADVQLPLLNIDMLYLRKAAQKQIEFSQLKSQRNQEYIQFDVQSAYLQVQLSYETVAVLEEAYVAAKATFDFTENRFQQGLLQKPDALNSKIHLATADRQLSEAKSNIKNASDYLSILMGKQPGVVYLVDRMPDVKFETVSAASEVSDGRADLRALQVAIESTGYVSKSSSMSYLPKLNAFGVYQLNDKEALGFNSKSYLAGLQLSWDIFKGTKTKHTIEAKNLEKDKLVRQLEEQKNQSRSELEKSYRQLTDTELAIQQYRIAIEQAEEAERILKDRYQQGLVNTTDVLMASSQSAQQKLALSQVIFKHHVTIAYLNFLTSTTH
ncbi:MAG: TolC family protein [Cyclobacteriaceae bacterium]|nr:TolC family protein [Cyclobacteriaceae bacterium]